MLFSFPDEFILFKKRHNTSCDIAEKVSVVCNIFHIQAYYKVR